MRSSTGPAQPARQRVLPPPQRSFRVPLQPRRGTALLAQVVDSYAKVFDAGLEHRDIADDVACLDARIDRVECFRHVGRWSLSHDPLFEERLRPAQLVTRPLNVGAVFVAGGVRVRAHWVFVAVHDHDDMPVIGDSRELSRLLQARGWNLWGWNHRLFCGVLLGHHGRRRGLRGGRGWSATWRWGLRFRLRILRGFVLRGFRGGVLLGRGVLGVRLLFSQRSSLSLKVETATPSELLAE